MLSAHPCHSAYGGGPMVLSCPPVLWHPLCLCLCFDMRSTVASVPLLWYVLDGGWHAHMQQPGCRQGALHVVLAHELLHVRHLQVSRRVFTPRHWRPFIWKSAALWQAPERRGWLDAAEGGGVICMLTESCALGSWEAGIGMGAVEEGCMSRSWAAAHQEIERQGQAGTTEYAHTSRKEPHFIGKESSWMTHCALHVCAHICRQNQEMPRCCCPQQKWHSQQKHTLQDLHWMQPKKELPC